MGAGGPLAMEYVLFVLYFSFFLCLCALVCLYFSGCQELTYRHEGRRPAGLGWGVQAPPGGPCARRLPPGAVVGDALARRRRVGHFGVPSFPHLCVF